MRIVAGTILMRLMRACEAVLSPGLLRLPLLLSVVPAAVNDFRSRRQLQAGWKHLGIIAPGVGACFSQFLRHHLARFLTFWPDRLASPAWASRFEIRGLEKIKALPAGKPAVLVCLHHGPIHILRYTLRAHGLPCAMVVLESRAERVPLRLWKDRLSPPANVPNVFCADELKAMQRFMETGGCLLVAVDYGRGKTLEVPFGPAKIRVASGAFRMAHSVGAHVFPVSICETSAWRFSVEIGDGMPGTGDMEAVAQKVLASLARKVLATPEQMHSQLADSLLAS